MKKMPNILVILLLFLVACSDRDASSDGIIGKVLIWHTWEGAEREILVGLLDEFMELNPAVTLVEESLTPSEMAEDFFEQTHSGYGPDIIIAPSDISRHLVQQRLVRDLYDQDVIDTDVFLSSAIGILQDGESLFGIPFSLNTLTLYYNKALLGEPMATASVEEMLTLIDEQQQLITDTVAVETLNTLTAQIKGQGQEAEVLEPATDLETLLHHADLGHQVALRSDFYGAFWGIHTFGGQLFDDEGRVVLNQGGFANWLGWLKRAKNNPHILLNRRPDVLQGLFTSGQATYYVGDSKELPHLQETLGRDVVGVIRLPGRPNSPSGPFLEVETIMFNRASSDNSLEAGLHLAHFLTTTEQQQTLALLAERLPVNKFVEIDPRVSPIMAELVAQSHTTIPISLENNEKVNDLIALGDPIYSLMLDGEMSVGEAATQLTEQINDLYGLETVLADIPDCTASGTIILQHAWTGAAELALAEIVEQFHTDCPNADITLENVNATTLYDEFLNEAEGEERPSLIIGSNQWLVDFASAGVIQDVSSSVHPDFTQRFIPVVEESAIYENRQYGIPVTLDIFALYFNRDLVLDPPVVLDDLLTSVNDDARFGLPLGFYESYWGIAAFGEIRNHSLFDEEGRLIIGKGGLTEWLAWLKEEVQTQPSMVISTDSGHLQEMFMAEELAYLAGESSILSELQVALGDDKVGVVHLPSGAPLLLVDMFMINADASEEKQALALSFAEYAAGLESQDRLMRLANKIPTNVNAHTGDYEAVRGFIKQIETAVQIPNVPAMKTVFERGDLVYVQVLDNNIVPADAVADFSNLVDVANGFEVALVEEPVTAEGCIDEGQITLWHSWSTQQQSAWRQVIADFGQLCPQIQIEMVFVSAQSINEQLAMTLEAGSNLSLPDFFIASHADLESYQVAGLVADISSFVDDSVLLNYLPQGVTAVSIEDTIYGLPQAIEIQALYYHPEMVTEPATTFDQLLAQATEGLPLGLSADFADLFWGAAAFGCQLCQAETFLDEDGALALSRSDFADWLAWLEEAQATGSVIISDDKAALQQMFIAGELAYLVDSSASLNQFQDGLGVANVGVIGLPTNLLTGEDNLPSAPLMQVDGFMFYEEATQTQTALALKFAQFATAQANQVFLMETANYVPTHNLAAVAADDAAILVFLDGLETAVLRPGAAEWALLEGETAVYTLFNDLIAEPKLED